MTSSRLVLAVHVLTLLEHEGGGPLASDCIAGSVNTNPVVIRRLVAMLVRAGLVSCTAGPGGGARLAKPARTLTLRDVYAAVEPGELFAAHASTPNRDCPVGRHIQSALDTHLSRAARAMLDALDEVTIASLARSVTARANRRSA